jgi:hypothetical protein
MTSDRNSLLRLDENGVPILDEVVEPPPPDDLAAAIKAQLLAELEPHLLHILHGAMTESIKAGALELKRSFEHQLDRNLEIRVHELVEQAVERACRETER